MQHIFVPSLLLGSLGILEIRGDFKVWRQSTDLGNPSLWLDRKLPCPGQRVILPPEVVYFPSTLATDFGSEIILPHDGLVVFARDSHLDFALNASNQDSRSDCDQALGDAVLPAQPFHHWHDPGFWRATADPSPVPHSDQIPCRYDHVVFPSEAAYKVVIGHHETSIARLTVDGQGFDTTAFRAMANTSIGALMFRIESSLSILHDHCTDPLGCSCGNRPIYGTICQMEGAACKYQRICSSPLKPVGHCCYDVCGSIIHIEAGAKPLKISLLQDVIEQQMVAASRQGSKPGPGEAQRLVSPISHYISRISEREYQIVVVDTSGNVQAAVDLGRMVYKTLRPELDSLGTYSWLEESDVSPPSALKSAGQVLEYAAVMALIVALVYLAHLAYTKTAAQPPGLASKAPFGSWSSLSTSVGSSFNWSQFRRPFRAHGDAPSSGISFGRLSEPNSIEMEDDSSEVQFDASEARMTFRSLQEADEFSNEDEEELGQSFTNPMFEKVPKSALDKLDASDTPQEPASLSEFTNPIFDQAPDPSTPPSPRPESAASHEGFDNPNYVPEPVAEVPSLTLVTSSTAEDPTPPEEKGYFNPNYEPDALDPPPAGELADVGATINALESEAPRDVAELPLVDIMEGLPPSSPAEVVESVLQATTREMDPAIEKAEEPPSPAQADPSSEASEPGPSETGPAEGTEPWGVKADPGLEESPASPTELAGQAGEDAAPVADV